MTRRIGSGTLVIATHNAGKMKEIGALLEPYGVKCISAGSLGLPEPKVGLIAIGGGVHRLVRQAGPVALRPQWPNCR